MNTLPARLSGTSLRWLPSSVGMLLLAANLAAAAPVTFVDVAATAGVGKSTESYGASWGDVNGDGYLDLFVSNHREQPSLYINRGNGAFTDVATQVKTWVYHVNADTHGGAFADYDNDGDQDLLITTGTGNPSQFLVNEQGAMIDRTTAAGIDFASVGGRLPVWFDYNGDGLADFVLTQFGGAARVFRQTPTGFVETTSPLGVVCLQFHFGLLLDVNEDERLDFLCAGNDNAGNVFPQKIYNTYPSPWQNITTLFPGISTSPDAVIADFNNDGRMDVFALSNQQLRPSNVLLSSPNIIEANLTGGEKGFNFVSNGQVTVALDWNRIDEGNGLPRILIGTAQINPSQVPFTLDPADPSVWGVPPSNPALAPVMRIGFDPGTGRWTFIAESGDLFSEAYYVVTTAVPVTDLQSTGLWSGDLTGSSTLMMNLPGGFSDQTVAAGLATPNQCSSITTGDFDNDMDVDLYLACRSGVENLPNIYLDNQGDGTFVTVPGAGGATGPVGSNVTSGAGTADTAVAADYDLDGFLDVFVANGFGLRPLYFGGPGSLFRNQGNGNHWIQLDLVGTTGTRDPVGAVVTAVANSVTQYRVYNGGYHRWAQEPTRMHFGLAGATSVDITVKWPNGATEVFSAVPADQLYRITEGAGAPDVVTPGEGAPYPCGTPAYGAGSDRGVFIWRDCVNDQWRVRFSPGGVATTFTGDVRSTAVFPSVTPYSVDAADILDTTTDPRRISFQMATANSNQDGFNLVLNENSHTCFRMTAPAGIPVWYGPFETPMSGDFDIQTGGPCQVDLPEITVSDVSAAENAGQIEFQISLSAAAANPVSVDVETGEATAIDGLDFTALSTTTVTFAAGETQKQVSVPIVNDTEGEDDETFLLKLTAPVGATLATSQAVGTILDDEVSACGGVPAYNAATEAGIFMGKSCLTGRWEIRMTAGGSATTIYHEGTLVSTTAFAEVTPFSVETADLFDSTTDPLVLSYRLGVTGANTDGINMVPALGAATCFNLASSGTVYVGRTRMVVTPPFDLETLGPCNTVVPQVSIAPTSVPEDAGTVDVTVSLNTAGAGSVSVDVQTLDGTALAGTDYVALEPLTLTFSPGETSKTVTLSIIDDSLQENPENFTVQLSNVSGATQGTMSALVTISDDEVSACGDPAIDANADSGIFFWRQCGTDDWSMRVSGGVASGSYQGSILSTAPYDQVTGVSIEGPDVLDYTSAPLQISYALEAAAGTLDGADFRTAPGAAACVRVDAPAGATVYLGAARMTMTAPFDLQTLGACTGLPPAMSLSVPSVGEADGSASITVTLSEASAAEVSADIEILPGTATPEADYLGLGTTTVVIPAGETSVTLNLPVIDDAIAEGDEQLTVRLSNPVNATFTNSQAVMTITDNEVSPCGTPTINPATEPGVFLWKDCSTGQWTMRVIGGGVTNTRTYSGSIVSSTSFSQISGFSIEGSDVLDYTSNPAVAQWTLNVTGSGQDGVDFRPATISETCFNVVLPVGTAVAVGPAKTLVAPPFDLTTLGACGASPQLSIHDVSVAESAQASFTVTMTKPAVTAVTVDYASSDGTAVAPADYAAVASTLTIPAGSLTADVTVDIVDDGAIETTESFTVQLSNPVGIAISDGTATGSIIDNDVAGLAVDDVVASETDASLSFTVSLSTPSLDPVTVDVMTVDVEAVAGTDFTAVPLTTLTFAPGEVSKTVVVTLSNDSEIEGFETFRLELSNATGAAIAIAAGVATINDDEPPPVVSIAAATADENAGVLSFNVSLSVASAQPVSVDYMTVDGTAMAAEDYVAVPSGTLVFAPGETLKAISVSLTDDSLSEPDETFSIQLSNPVRAAAGVMSAEGTIIDDEGNPTLTVDDVTAAETAGSLTFTATLSAPSSHSVSVDYATVNGNATAPQDFSAVSGTLVFPPGSTSQTVVVTLLDDLLLEQNESFTLDLSNPVHAVLGTTSATATITDDEAQVCGEPSYNATTESVVAVWKNCTTGTWSVRSTAGGNTFQAYTGNISSNQGLSGIVGVNLEPADLLEYGVNPTKLNFRMQLSPPGFDGFDFELSSDATACFTTGLPNGATVIVGANRVVVGGSFDLRTLGACQTLPTLSAANVDVTEDDGTASFQLTLSSASSLPVSVDYVTVGDSAQSGVDFEAAGPATITFMPGETSKTIDITLIDDSEVELAETFNLQLSHIVNGSFGPAAISQSVVATITDDEIPLVFNVDNVGVSESAGSLAFTVALSTTSAAEARVTVATADGTAKAGSDYTALGPVELVFAPGETAKQVTLTLLDDVLAEGPESFQVELSNPVGAAIGTGTATVSVTDNEPSPCGDPGYNAATETGLFIWKNCTSGVWSARYVAASGYTVYTGTVVSSQPLVSMTPFSIEGTDVLDATTNPTQISYSLRVGAGNVDGFDFQTQAGSGSCVNISSPTGRPVYVGAARTLVGLPFSLETLQACP